MMQVNSVAELRQNIELKKLNDEGIHVSNNMVLWMHIEIVFLLI